MRADFRPGYFVHRLLVATRPGPVAPRGGPIERGCECAACLPVPYPSAASLA